MDILEFLRQNEEKDLLRFSTAGSVDDGKSTMIGRLLIDSKLVYEDHLASLRKDSARRGAVENEVDYSLLLDGLRAEREQNITIDVAYRYFSTPRRKFIIADTPGHEQYTRNMATGASTADLAVILIDARHGVVVQSKRHSFIMSLLGIRHLVVAVNKMDAVDYSREIYERIRKDFTSFAARLQIQDITFIPMSALKGDNVVTHSDAMPWYNGRSLLEHLETVHVTSDRNLIDLRLPVQIVLRPHQGFRGYAGTVASGIIRRGDEVMVLPSGRKSRVKSLVTGDGEVEEAFPPMAVTVTLEDEIDVSRGDMLAHVNNLPKTGNMVEAMVVWMSDTPFEEGSTYIVKQTTMTAQATLKDLRYRVDVNTLHRENTGSLGLNEIGRAVMSFNRPILFDPYERNRATGAFILIDRLTNVTVGAAMILDRRPNELVVSHRAAERRDPAVHPHGSAVSPDERRSRLNQSSGTVWLTGLPKSGKSTIAYALERRLFDMGFQPMVLDGSNMRLGVSSDLGFSADDRSENARRAASVARLMNEAGLIVIVALVSPYADDRALARQSVGGDRFIEVYVSTPAGVCRKRDDEGLYAGADAGRIENFSGVTAPYEPPGNPDCILPAHEIGVEEEVDRIVSILRERGMIH